MVQRKCKPNAIKLAWIAEVQPFLSKDTRNKIVEVKVDGLPTSTHFTIFVVEIRALRMDELQYFIEQKRGLLARESNSCPALDYSEGMAADEQKRYIPQIRNL